MNIYRAKINSGDGSGAFWLNLTATDFDHACDKFRQHCAELSLHYHGESYWFNDLHFLERCSDPTSESKSPINNSTTQETTSPGLYLAVYDAWEGDHDWTVQEFIHTSSDSDAKWLAKNRQYSEIGGYGKKLVGLYKIEKQLDW
jgi:hypothetical protein